jgi:hypothetical protein
VFCSFQNSGRCIKCRTPVILSVIHNRKSPLSPTISVLTKVFNYETELRGVKRKSKNANLSYAYLSKHYSMKTYKGVMNINIYIYIYILSRTTDGWWCGM